MNDHQRFAYAHPCPNAHGALAAEYFRGVQRGRRLWAIALSVNR